MREVNSKITEKIHSLIGDDAPSELLDFFDRMLERQIKQETALFSPAEMSEFYYREIVKVAQNSTVIKYIEEKNNE